ncbi:MAG: GYDIA family GHMP kinase [Bacteroidota bacterium]
MEKTFLKDKSIEKQTFSSPGKLLLTGEYLVLKGAQSIGLKCQFQQDLEIEKNTEEHYSWQALDPSGETWIDIKFHDRNGAFEVFDDYGSQAISKEKLRTLFALLHQVRKQRPDLFASHLSFKSHLTFEREWGLGSSSTLIANLAKWSGADPFELSDNSFGGSAYDVAVGMANQHILYCIEEDERHVQNINFNPQFRENIFFVHLNEKRNSRAAIQAFYKEIGSLELQHYIDTLSAISHEVISASALEEFEDALFEHETILSKILKEKTVKERLFSDYRGGICKSLGAWGGDFILATGNKENWAYFREKGYNQIMAFDELIA